MACGLPLPMLVLAVNVGLGELAGGTAWAVFCVTSTFVSLSQPYVGQRAPPALAGRALSAFNLVIFGGVFTMQWGMGALIGSLKSLGWGPLAAYRATFGLFCLLVLLAYLWFP
jgi:hypothetical protein